MATLLQPVTGLHVSVVHNNESSQVPEISIRSHTPVTVLHVLVLHISDTHGSPLLSFGGVNIFVHVWVQVGHPVTAPSELMRIIC